MFDLAKEMKIEAKACTVSLETLRAGRRDLHGTTAGGIMPVRSLDGVPVSGGKPGPITTRLRDAYWKAHDDPRYLTPVNYR